jgi:UDP-2,3-diacylglucosamine hydrolase
MQRAIPPILDLPPLALPITVVGDVHLSEEDDELTLRFLNWLEGQAGRGGTLVLLGDIFDLWVGRAQQTDPLPARVFRVLKRLAESGTRLTFMPGNRDLLFSGVDGVPIELWPDPVRIRQGERTVVYTHGDQLCTADTGYLGMRDFFYGPGGTLMNWLIPFRAKRWMGEGMRRLSTRATGRKDTTTMDIDYAEAMRWMEHYEAEVLVAGHVHTGVHHRFAGPPAREVLVLKDWERSGGVIVSEGEAFRLALADHG